MKKSRKFLWAMLPVAAAFALTACSSSDDAIEKDSQTVTTIPYSITVGSSTTRATVGNNKEDLYFAEGDEIYLTSDGSDKIKGRLTLVDGVGQALGKFEGTITYKGEKPANNAGLTLVLKSKEQMGLIIDENTYKPTFSLDNVNTFAETLQDAVKKFSYIEGPRQFALPYASLVQNKTAFIDFAITINGAEAGVDKWPVSVTSADGQKTYAEGQVSVTPVVGQPTVAALAKFAIAVSQGTIMKGAVVTVGDYTYTFNKAESEQPLQPKVYNTAVIISQN